MAEGYPLRVGTIIDKPTQKLLVLLEIRKTKRLKQFARPPQRHMLHTTLHMHQRSKGYDTFVIIGYLANL